MVKTHWWVIIRDPDKTPRIELRTDFAQKDCTWGEGRLYQLIFEEICGDYQDTFASMYLQKVFHKVLEDIQTI